MSRPKRKDKPYTFNEVAEIAGVCTMTVSRVMRGKSYVSEKTRQRVLDAANELGYVHNRIAGSLASAHSSQIAVIIPSLKNIVFPELLDGITDVLDNTNYQAIIGVTDYDLERERDLIHSMIAWRPAGIILTNASHHQDVHRLLSKVSIPIVETMELTRKPIDMCVGIDHRRAGAGMARYLLKKGYRKFGYLGSDHSFDQTAGKRFEGFSDTVEKNEGSIEVKLTVPEQSGIKLGRNNIAQILDNHPDVEVVYFSNDAVAAGAMMFCLAKNIRIPEDLAIASFSGLEIADAMPLAITTTLSPRYDMGKISAEHLMQRLEGETPPAIKNAGFKLRIGQTT